MHVIYENVDFFPAYPRRAGSFEFYIFKVQYNFFVKLT